MVIRAVRLCVILLTVLSLARDARAQAGGGADGWALVRTRNFLVFCEAGEGEARRAAERLEVYRAAFEQVLPPEYFERQATATVVLFRDDRTYASFRPILAGNRATGVAGYFQPGATADYITALLGPAQGADSSTLLHEYAHLLVNNYFDRAPLWLKEGLAEYYGTAVLSGDRRRITLGAPPRRSAHLIRRRALLPLRTLFAVDQGSPYYNEPEGRSLFYAQSWALVHYFLNGGGPERRAGFKRFLNLLSSGARAEEALRGALGETADGVARGLAAYAAGGAFRVRAEALGVAAEPGSEFHAGPVSRSQLLACLGDLLAQTGRVEEGEARLREAVELDPDLAEANLALGALLVRRGRFTEALGPLRKAADAGGSHLAHYYLAEALDREGLGMGPDDLSVGGFEEKTRLIRGELARAIALAPRFVEAHRLLAVVEIERGGRYEEAEAHARRALELAPRRPDLLLVLAHASLSRNDLAGARRLAEPVAARHSDALLRTRAETLLERIASREKLLSESREREEEASRLAAAEAGPLQPCDMPEPGPFHKRLRFRGEQACGRLVEVECPDSSVVFLVEAGGRVLRLRADSFSRVRLVTYTTGVGGRLSCGPRERADGVLVTYRPVRPDAAGAYDGEALAVEFVPLDWNR